MSTTIPTATNSLAAANGSVHGAVKQLMPPTAKHTIAAWRAGEAWHSSAPGSLKRSWKRLDPPEAWQRWKKHLVKRKSSIQLAKLCAGKRDPLQWGTPTSEDPIDGAAWTEAPIPQLEQVWFLAADQPGEAVTLSQALMAVALAYQLPQLAERCDEETWWQVATALMQLAAQQQSALGDETDPHDWLLATLLGGELPLVLAVNFPELKPLRELFPAARRHLGEGLVAATDGEGLIAARLLPVLPPLFASWTRARAIGTMLKKGCWSSDAETQYEWLVRQTMLLLRADGTPAFSHQAYSGWPAEALVTALQLVGDESDHAAAAARFKKALTGSDVAYDADDLPDAVIDSEWAGLSVLSSGWQKSSQRVIVDYSRPTLRLEVESRGHLLFSGDWTAETLFNGKRLEPSDEWEQQCWYDDEECSLLELAIPLTGGARLERQILLGKEDGFLWLHDIVHAEETPPADAAEPAAWQHAMTLPLTGGIAWAAEQETRDGLLVDAQGTVRAGVMPVALAEWRVDPRAGELALAEGPTEHETLSLSQQATGRRLSCPLWIDLKGRRAAKQRTWRQLTVAESLEVVSRDVAVGYRVQSGNEQWLVYRSLTEPKNRTVLGQNTSSEMVVGRFLRSTGMLEEIIDVVPEEEA